MSTLQIALRCALLVVCFQLRAYAETCARCEISEQQEAAYDALLELSDAEKDDAVMTHLPWGVPENPPNASNEHLLFQHEYIINYDDDLRVPVWTAYQLTDDDLADPVTRLDCFRSDPRLDDDQSAFCADYEEPIYDRGHMARSNDMARTEGAMINTFIFSNICPQFPNFNRQNRPWNHLEEIVQDWAWDRGRIYVFTGAVFDRDEDGQRDADNDAERMEPEQRVAIPSHFYKIILHERPNGFIESLTILLPHRNSWSGSLNNYLRSNITSIAEVEQCTGIDFLPLLDEPKKTAVKNFVAPNLFPLETPLFNLVAATGATDARRALRARTGERSLLVQRDDLLGRAATRESIGRPTRTAPMVPQSSAPTTAQGPSARYAVVPGRSGDSQFYLIDLRTGRTWTMLNVNGQDQWRELGSPDSRGNADSFDRSEDV